MEILLHSTKFYNSSIGRKTPSVFLYSSVDKLGGSSALVEGVKKTIKTLMMGLAHGIFKRLGYLDPKFLNVD